MTTQPEQKALEPVIEPKSGGGLALTRMDPTALQEVMSANVGAGGLQIGDLDRVRIPAGGGRSWTIPSLTGDQEAREITGVIIHWADRRVYWAEAFSGSGQPPDCYSQDMIMGRGDPGGPCQTCPLSQWESDPKGGRGQACKQIRQIFIAKEGGQLLPIVVALPPTSIQPVKKYFLRLASAELPYWAVMTKLTLEQASSGQGIKYSRAVSQMTRQLSPEERSTVEAYRNAIRPALDQVAVEQADYSIVEN